MSKGSRRQRPDGARASAATSIEDIHRAGRHRHDRLQLIFKEELDAILRDEIVDPSLEDVTFTSVEVSIDYKHARVRFVTPQGRRIVAERALARATPFFRARLAEAIDLKQVPALRFAFDADAMRYD